MNIAFRKPWTQDQFLAWAETQDARYEFDGFQGVAMTGGTNNASIRRCMILEFSSIGLTVIEREGPGEVWRTTVLTSNDILRMTEIGVEMPVDDIYEDVDFADQDPASG